MEVFLTRLTELRPKLSGIRNSISTVSTSATDCDKMDSRADTESESITVDERTSTDSFSTVFLLLRQPAQRLTTAKTAMTALVFMEYDFIGLFN